MVPIQNFSIDDNTWCQMSNLLDLSDVNMADVSVLVDKKLKLANTRKRFKELQELKKKKNIAHDDTSNVDATSETHTPNESLTSSTHSQTNNEVLQENTVRHAFENATLGDFNAHKISNVQENVVQQSSAVPFNYFNSNSVNAQPPTNFFDSFSQDNLQTQSVSPIISNYFSNAQSCSNRENAVHRPQYSPSEFHPHNAESSKSNDNYSLFPQQLQNSYVSDFQNMTNLSADDNISMDDPEIKQNEIREYQQEIKHMQESKLFSDENSKDLLNYLNGGSEDNKEVMTINYEIDEASNATIKEVQHSSMESVKQLSGQMAQMIGASSEPSYEFASSGSITDLEKRNMELVASLDREKMSSVQLKAINDEYKARIAEFEKEQKERKLMGGLETAQEVSRLKEELQAHIQTVGILYAEKTEITASLTQYELTAKQKSAECEDLQGRLKASRSRVADLEKELNILRDERSRIANVEQEHGDALAKLKEEYALVTQQKEEYIQDLMEVREKLKTSYEENSQLRQQIGDIAGKLSLAEIKIQQLSSGSSLQIDGQLEKLTQDKFGLEKQVATQNETIKTITKERDESSTQYQLYAQQLNAQLANMSNKIQQLSDENESLKTQERNRVKHIGELERQLQNVQHEQMSYPQKSNNEADLQNELSSQKELAVRLQIEKNRLEEDFTRASNEKELLSKELNAKNDSISQLESLIEQLRGNQPDSVKLLATMESDKVAAARAVQQNKELKEQMESMQEVFMKLNNDKVELTENLARTTQENRDIFEKLQKTEIHLQTLADAIEIKDKELTHLRENSSELQKHFFQQEQLNDRLRHYEAQEHGAHALQNDLQEARQTIEHLANEINSLRATKNVVTTENVAQTTVDGSENQPIDNQGLEEICRKLKALEVKNRELEENLMKKAVNETDYNKQQKNDSNQNVLDKDNAMRHLEEKVTKTMQEIADLTDEKQRLEHIVLQLQGETETIGEYVALYQHQRMMLKQRALEKDQQLKQLADDREQIKTKLDKLNDLIKKLVVEKGALPQELLQHQANMNNQTENLCDEHSKMNEEINKITENHMQNSQGDSTETAQEIIELLGEIKTSNLVQPDENYHHCPYCSGQLITV